MNLKILFETRILERGRDYFRSGAVTDLHTSDNTLTATVAGSADYEVTVTLENGEPSDLYCSCPYAADGKNCKHMAAVLLAYGAKDADFQFPSSEKTTAELIAEADPDSLRAFLLDAASRDPALSASLALYLNRNADTVDLAAYDKSIRYAVRQYSDSDGYIDYNSAPGFLDVMEQYLNDDVTILTESGNITEAFVLCNLLFRTFSEVDIDDDGQLSQFGSDTVEAWGKIIAHADASQRGEMFRWFMEHLNGWVVDFMEEYIEQALFDYFDEPEFLQSKLEYVDRQIAQTAADSYRHEDWILRRLRLMEQMKTPADALLAYAKQFEALANVRDYLIEYYISHDNAQDAVALLEMALEADSRYDHTRQYREKLKTLYQMQGAEEKYREQLWQLAAEYGDLECFRELKALCPADEWNAVRDRLLADAAEGFLPAFYQEEALYDRLMQYVSRAGSISVLRKYEYLLVRQYAAEILRLYADMLENAARAAAGRAAYKEWAYCLKHMCLIEGGAEAAKAIAEKWLTQYRNRPAMIEELRRAGF